MTIDQLLLFSLFGAVLGLLLWGRVRHDLVAASGLFCAVLLGLVPQDTAFSGFSNPAVLIVALVLITSRAFENTGLLALASQIVAEKSHPISAHVAKIGGLGAGLSALINNVAALAMLMPVDVQAARKAGRPPGLTLMPLAFATILGGMVTLIGTPPNIIASSIRNEHLGKPYSMFDFSPVGGVVAIAGLFFIALAGWRLVPRREDKPAEIDPSSFEAQLIVPETSKIVGKIGAELEEAAREADVVLAGLLRGNEGQRRRVRYSIVQSGDLLVVEGSSEAIAAFITAAELQDPSDTDTKESENRSSYAHKGSGQAAAAEKTVPKLDNQAGNGDEKDQVDDRGPEIVEAVVRLESPLAGRSAMSIGLRDRFDVTLLGISRHGYLSRDKISDRIIRAGDELLLIGRNSSSPAILQRLGLLAINRVPIANYNSRNIAITLILFFCCNCSGNSGHSVFCRRDRHRRDGLRCARDSARKGFLYTD